MAIDKKYTLFPSEFSDGVTKATNKYGMDYAKAIWSAYLKNGQTLMERKQRDIINRKYGEGMESIEKYKDRLDLKGDTSFLNLDFNPTTRIASIVDKIVGRLMNVEYKIQCNAIDPASKTKEDDDRKEMYTNMLLKKASKQIEEQTGVPVVPKDQFIPEDDEEAELHFQINYKQDASIAMEEALDYVFYNNDMKDTRRRLLRDLVVLKKGLLHYYYDEEYNIKFSYEDPVDLIVPYSRYDDFRNIPYASLIKNFTIREIAMMTDEFSEEQLYDIAKSQVGKNNNPVWNSMWGMTYQGYYMSNPGMGYRPYDDFNISVLKFYFLTTNYEKYSEKQTGSGNTFFQKRGTDYVAPKESKFQYKIYDKKIQYRYDGNWIIGTDHVFNYGMAENIERPKVNGGYSPKAELPFIILWPNIYDMENKSHVERLIPHEDQINLINLKKQTFLIKAAPPGIAIDTAGLDEVTAGMGNGGLDPIKITKMHNQVGSFVYSSRDAQGNVINSKVIQELPNGLSPSFGLLIEAYNHEIQLMNDVVGDINAPAPDSLVQTAKITIQNMNESLRELLDGSIRMIEKGSRRLSLMIQDSFEYGNEGFKMALGQYSEMALSYGDKIPLHEYGIKIELMPDDEERAQVMEDIQLGIQQGLLMSSDAVIIRSILKQNPKLAAQMLVLREKKNQQAKADQAQKDQQMNAQVQIQSAQAAKQGEMELEKMKTQNAALLLNLEWDRKDKHEVLKHSNNMEHQDKKNEGAENVAEVSHEGKLGLAAFNNATKVAAQ